MYETFKKELYIKNVEFLLKDSGRGIYVLEKYIGVSRGYISRIRKDAKVVPSINAIIATANFFSVSVDNLLFVDLSTVTELERKLTAFLEKICRLTIERELDWHIVHPEELGGLTSETLGDKGRIEGTCFWFEMQPKIQVYVLPVTVSDKASVPDGITEDTVIEMQIKTEKTRSLLTSSLNENHRRLIKELWKTLKDHEKYPLKDWVREVIDAFINGEVHEE